MTHLPIHHPSGQRAFRGAATTAYAILALTILVFIPVFHDPYTVLKTLTVGFGAALVVLLLLAESRQHRAIPLPFNPYPTLSLCLMAAVSGLSVAFVSPNKIAAVLSPFGPITFIGMAVLLYGITATRLTRTQRRLPLLVAATLLGVLTLIQSVVSEFFPHLRSPYLSPLQTPTGNPIATAFILLISVPAFVEPLMERHLAAERKAVLLVTGCIVLLAAVLIGAEIAGGYTKASLPLQYGWTISIRSLETTRDAILGIGTDNFLYAFTKGRPVEMNMSPVWNVRYLLNSSFMLHVLTTNGMLGLAAMVVFGISLFMTSTTPFGIVERIFSVLALVVLPPSLPLLVGVILLYDDSLTRLPDHHGSAIRFPASAALVVGVIAVLLFGGLVIGSSAMVWSQYIYARGLDQVSHGASTDAYLSFSKATRIFPQNYEIHMSLSQTSLALSRATLKKALDDAGESETIQPKDQELVAELMKQSVTEAKQAVANAPQNVIVWENLAKTYQSLIGAITNADQWALAAWTQAAILDPTYPQIRINTGGLYLTREDWENAENQFLAAVSLKPDLSNAHYNLAYTYRKQGNHLGAARSLYNALMYVNRTSSDYQRLNSELIESLNNLTPGERDLYERNKSTVITPSSNRTKRDGGSTGALPTILPQDPFEYPNQ